MTEKRVPVDENPLPLQDSAADADRSGIEEYQVDLVGTEGLCHVREQRHIIDAIRLSKVHRNIAVSKGAWPISKETAKKIGKKNAILPIEVSPQPFNTLQNVFRKTFQLYHEQRISQGAAF
jgi:hypothetical protein